jgi:4-hydroxymandelate oxidase
VAQRFFLSVRRWLPGKETSMSRRRMLQTTTATLAGLVAARPLLAQAAAAPARSKEPAQPVAGALPVNVREYEEAARRRLTRMAYDYVAGGGADEITLRRNRESFDKLLLRPRALVDVSQLSTRTTLFGQALEYPILLAPTAYHKLMHPRGELATVEGAAAAGATMIVSSFATTSIEDVARNARTPLWFQLYAQPDQAFTRDLVQRAEAAGCRALVVTVDTPITPMRDRESRHNFALPPGMQLENLKDLLSRSKASAAHRALAGIYSAVLNPKFTWGTVDWLRSFAKTPVLLKGIIAPEDARIAAENGIAGIVVSNHGARNLDTSPASIEALPRVMDAVAGRTAVLMDGGIRRGTDVVKALAYGAQAVLVGRPYLFALAARGAAGVQHVFDMLRTELEAAMALCGVRSLSEIDRRIFW